MSFRHFRLGIIAIFIYVGVEVAIPSIANLYMTQTAEAGGLAMPAAIAGTLCGTYWFLMFVGRLVGGLLGGKVSPKLMLGTVLSIAAVFVLLAMFLPSGITVKMPVFRADISFGLEDVPLPIMFLILCGLHGDGLWRRHSSRTSGLDCRHDLQLHQQLLGCVCRHHLHALFFIFWFQECEQRYPYGIAER